MRKHELEKKLRDAGCVLLRHGSNHDIWLNPKTRDCEPIPRHAKEVAKGTALKVNKKLVRE